MAYIEDILETQKRMYGEYHPKRKNKSCVMVRDVGCVFIGTVEQCQEYIRNNEWRYEKQNSRRLVTHGNYMEASNAGG
jgi:hypothetical protein